MYVIGGRDAGGETTLDTHIYNVKCNSWVELEGFCKYWLFLNEDDRFGSTLQKNPPNPHLVSFQMSRSMARPQPISAAQVPST